jgi:hypothetical protein
LYKENIMAGGLTISTLNDSSGVLATQNGMKGIAKAWVNFNGGNAAINGSFNVSSVTRTSTGRYAVNFSTAMPDANYAMAGFSAGGGVAWTVYGGGDYGYPTASQAIFSSGYANGSYDATVVHLAVFR